MVKIEIQLFVEGGVLPNENLAVETMNNSNKLRESLHHLLSQLITPNKFDLIILPRSSNNQTVKDFKADLEKDSNSLLLIDLDAPKSEKNTKITKLDLVECAEKVFFMVQEMEAWVLSQPKIIEEFAKQKDYKRKNTDKIIAENTLLKGKNIEEISKPSDTLNTLLGQYFEVYEKRRDKHKPATYGKLKDAPDLLKLLNFSKLLNDFEDVRLLKMKIESL
jgi:hypothetical protein